MKRILVAACSFSILAVCFQNCSSGFVASGVPMSQDIGSTGTARMTTSMILVGGENFISSYSLNHQTDQVSFLKRTSVTGQPGWLAFDSVSSTVLAPDANGTALNQVQLSLADGSMKVQKVFDFLSRSVHLLLSRHDGILSLYGSSYSDQKYAAFDFNADQTQITKRHEFEYSPGAHTHSSSMDAKSRLMFVANKDEDRVVILSSANDQLAEVGEISIADPRIVAFDAEFKRLYVVTEADAGQSRLQSFEITRSSGTVTVLPGASFMMGARGSGLAIDHVNGYIVASVREAGKEGLWALPVTAAGLFDATRATKFIPVKGIEARSLDITADGKYYIVTCNDSKNAEDLFVYKISYDSTHQITSTDLVQSINVGEGGFLSQLVLTQNPL
ncbi:MAG: hypothetical protein EOP06_07535 [Proteobacteria bacterium]|nr:MAG: hypothetical protein EOP06_07535 [Pseudomonadota bacterium]